MWRKTLQLFTGFSRKIRRLRKSHDLPVMAKNPLVPELDLEAPLFLPKVCVVRALLDRMLPGRQVILRSSDLEMPWEMEHLCNCLGHELIEVGREGATCFFTLRVRGPMDRRPRRDPGRLTLSPQLPIHTLDIRRDRLTPGGRAVKRLHPGRNEGSREENPGCT